MEKVHFDAFYRAFVKRIYAFVYFRVGGNKALAEDLVQDIFLKAYEAFERFDPTIGESAWIYTIARNHVINTMAKQRPGVDIETIEDSVLVSADARLQFTRYDMERHLLEAVGRLDKDNAQLIRMKYLEGWTFEDLAEIFGKTPGTLRVQASRALKKLKGLMKKHL